jgi:hypothetical protein
MAMAVCTVWAFLFWSALLLHTLCSQFMNNQYSNRSYMTYKRLDYGIIVKKSNIL